MDFYTNVYQRGDNLMVRGYEGNQPVSFKIEFKPTLYVTSSKDKSETYKTLDGKNVYPIRPGSIRDCREFFNTYKDIDGFEVFGNTNYIQQYISDTYRGEIQWDQELVKVYSLDIETKTEEGFPNIETANEEIILISVQDNVTKQITTFGSQPYYGDDPQVKYVQSLNEAQLLKDFLSFWRNNPPDVVTGWNIEFFDIPYLIRRILSVLGENYAKKISPWGQFTERRLVVKGVEEIQYEIAGISSLDYLDLYKKYTYSNQESYRLDHIAYIELGERKKENPGENFKDFYTNYWEEFVDYNIQDARLVDRLEDKMRLIELQLTMAYNAKINYTDVFSQVRMWDAIIYNHLRDRDVVIPPNSGNRKDTQFEGAYVKDPLIGLHKWVVSFDLNSLYPHLIMQYNISPETIIPGRIQTNVEQLLSGKVDQQMLVDANATMTANGVCYTKEKIGFMPELMEKMYTGRSKYKKQMLKVQQEYEQTKDKKLLKEISRLNNLQMAMKIALNSAYGAMGNQYFRYFDIRMAEGITTSGQLSIRWIHDRMNQFMNKILKTEGDYIIAVDTDSIYVTFEKLIDTYYPDQSPEDTIKFMDKFCEDKVQPYIDKCYSELATMMNAYSQKMQMKREVLADKGIWIAKKRYILNVHNSEGVQYAKPKIKVMGLEMVKSSTPAVIRDKLRDSINVILAGDERTLHEYVATFRNEFNQMKVEDIAFPRGVNGMKTYAGTSSIYAKSTPIHVRGALLYNHYLKVKNLTQTHHVIKDGEKIKFVYLKTPNPINEDVISFLGTLPETLDLHKYIDYDKQFEKVFLDPMTNVIHPLGWHVEEQASLESFFV
jgi:DNA polymerase elongation subunit (family B)